MDAARSLGAGKATDAADPLAKQGRIALVLQGGGALGAYQVGVYEALHDAGLEPDWVAGVSIGGINAAIIAGNPPSCGSPACASSGPGSPRARYGSTRPRAATPYASCTMPGPR